VNVFATRRFTVGEAEALIPHLTRLFARIRPELERARRIAAELAENGAEVPPTGPLMVDPTARLEVQSRQATLQRCMERMSTSLQEIAELGVEIKSADGLVDFRTRRDGEVVYLCWRFGEPAIGHWHRVEAGFAGREPIQDPERFRGDWKQ
jgi:hypothetical protein